MKKLFFIIFVLVLVFLVLFLIGQQLGYFDGQFIREKLEEIRRQPLGDIKLALVIITLLTVDLFLPIPSMMLMTLAGMTFGFAQGTLVAFTGSFLSAWIGYEICRKGGQRWMEKLLGQKDHDKVQLWLERYGLFGIVIARPVPMLTEVLSCLAGLSGLKRGVFLAATALGHLPVSAMFSYAGSIGGFEKPGIAIAMAVLIPGLCLLGFKLWQSHAKRNASP